jgi:hypothetical protein
MEPLTQEEVIGLGAYCSSKNLSLQDWISISVSIIIFLVDSVSR